MINSNIAHYQITGKLGQGGMGEVYRATDTKLDCEVASHVLLQGLSHHIISRDRKGNEEDRRVAALLAMTTGLMAQGGLEVRQRTNSGHCEPTQGRRGNLPLCI